LALCAAGGETENEQFDFVGLHNISNHVINLKEGCNAATAFIRQCDSDSLRRDSQAMKIIANMTMLVLPTTALG
ncbi:MAG: hypothetical protein Q9223_007873, partial [Gallowayella weberi]